VKHEFQLVFIPFRTLRTLVSIILCGNIKIPVVKVEYIYKGFTANRPSRPDVELPALYLCRSIFMKCHKCPHHEAILRGDYDSTPWEDLPCATCKLGEDSFYSIPLDENRPSASYEDPTVERTKSSVPLAKEMPVSVLTDFLHSVMRLPADQRDIVSWRLQGLRYKEIAERQGTSTQLAEMRHKIAMRDCPALEYLFPRKTAKRRRWLSKR